MKRQCQAGEAGVDSESEEFAAGYFGRIWQTGRLVIENNVIELAVRSIAPYYEWGHAGGVRMYGYFYFPPRYPLVEVIIRGNIIRNLNDGSAPANRAIEVAGCERVLVERNVVGTDRAHSLEHSVPPGNEQIKTFNNTTPGGGLVKSYVQGSDDTAPEVVTQVVTELEDVMVSAFLKSQEE
jgi:hypothetical protein